MKQNEGSIAKAVETARLRISEQGRRLALILSLLVLLLSAMLYVFFYRALSVLFLVLPLPPTLARVLLIAIYAAVCILLTLLLLLPLFVGWMRQALEVARDGDAEPLSLFFAFSDGARYRAAVRWSAGFLIRLLLAVAVIAGTYLLSKRLFYGNLAAALLAALVILLELAAALLLLLQRFGALYFAAFDPRMPLRKARESVKWLSKADRRASLRYFAYYLPRILLGIATLGIYLLADVLPMMATAYFCDLDARVRALQQKDVEDSILEDINDHE